MYTKRGILWFRLDLRLHDNEAMLDALSHTDEVIPVYVFDERLFEHKTSYGFQKTGRYRAKFIIESIRDLRASLRARGSDLIVRVGHPEEELFEIAKQAKSSWIFCNRERTRDEVAVQDALEQRLWTIGQELRYSRGKLLYYTSDLPFPINHTPDTFSQFRKEVERYVPVREPLAAPEKMTDITVVLERGEIPTMEDLGYKDFENDSRATVDFKGGETEGLKRLKYFIWEAAQIPMYKEQSDELFCSDGSTKFSPWLAQGCLSPKLVYQELKRYEEEVGDQKSVNGIIVSLLKRDFLRFMAKKYGDQIFAEEGPGKITTFQWKDNNEALQRWIEGYTGIPFIDANMRELKHTGYMSYRGRMNVASYLIHDLQVNWKMGAEYFESMLIDYDIASNWGNWHYAAGVGSDSREHKQFNVTSQALRYDPRGEYAKLWMPELSNIPTEKFQEPDELSYAD